MVGGSVGVIQGNRQECSDCGTRLDGEAVEQVYIHGQESLGKYKE
jgi:hypothetical protein